MYSIYITYPMEYHEYMSKKVKNVAKKQIAKEIIKYVAMTGGVALCFTAPTAIPFLGIFSVGTQMNVIDICARFLCSIVVVCSKLFGMLKGGTHFSSPAAGIGRLGEFHFWICI